MVATCMLLNETGSKVKLFYDTRIHYTETCLTFPVRFDWRLGREGFAALSIESARINTKKATKSI